MEYLNLAEILSGGFKSAFTEFEQRQQERDMAINDKLQTVLANQEVSAQLQQQIAETINNETAQAVQALTTLTDTNNAQAQTIVEQGEQIKQLLAQLEQGSIDLQQAESAVDTIIANQQQMLASQQEQVAKISEIIQ